MQTRVDSVTLHEVSCRMDHVAATDCFSKQKFASRLGLLILIMA